MDKYIGQLLDNRYEILERVGVGGMAVVYKARCHRLNRLVAVKILRDEMAEDADIRRRFHDESKAVAMLSHPNIMAVYDVSHSQELDYIVMELLDGITLKRYMQRRGGKLSWKEALHFITQIMRALSHAHSRGIIHRDIKPQNIMILRDGSVKVADFGIARLTGGEQQEGMTQEALGSVHYISPEQARGSRIDARSDIYSAGVVLYEMLTGRRPFEGETPMAVAIQHIKSIPLSPREIDPDIPEAMEAVVLKAMAPNVDRRYVSADAMLADLEEFRKNPNINFDYESETVREEDEDEPTMILGANSPHVVHAVPAHEVEDADELSSRRRISGSAWASIAAVAVLLVGVAVFLWVGVFSGLFSGEETYPIPQLQGMTLEDARELESVVNAGFVIREGNHVTNEIYPEGQIVDQVPGIGESAFAGSTITVDISSGPEAVKMPGLFNNEKRMAQNRINQLKLDLVCDVRMEYHDTVTEGYVIRQEPAQDTVLERGQTVVLVVSQGPKLPDVSVITFATLTVEQARAQLDQMKLKFGGVTEVFDDTAPAGTIISHQPEAGASVPEGTQVFFTVSKGPEIIEPTPPPVVDPPAPTDAPNPAEIRRDVLVELPNDGRETVNIRIRVGNNEYAYYRSGVDTHLRSTYCSVRGVGVQTVTVYIDEVEVKSYTEVFE